MLLSKQNGEIPDWAESLLTSTVFLGSMIGMLIMGYLGDTIGRRRAMELTLLLTALGAAGSSLLTWGSADLRYILMAAWRMLMGVGIGGIYPLSSALSFEDTVQSAGSGVGGSAGQSKPMKESAIQPAGNVLIGAGSNDDEGQGNIEVNGKKITHSSDEMPSLTFEHFEEQRGRRKAVGWAAFWQQPGQMMPYVFGLLLLELFDFKDIEFQYRSILILGALPPFGILLTWGLEDRHSMFHIFNLKRHNCEAILHVLLIIYSYS